MTTTKLQHKPAHIRLADELHKLGLDEMADAAETGYYDDFMSELALPITQLVGDLTKAHTFSEGTRADDIMALRNRVLDGEFDHDYS